MFLFGPPDVEKLKARRNVPGLVKAVEYKKDSKDAGAVEVRRQAAAALGEIGEAAGIDALIAALHDVHEQVREAASQALRKINDPRAAKPFVDMWMHSAELERAAIKAILVKMGLPAVQAVLPMLSHNSPVIRETAAKLLGRLGAPAVEPLVAEIDRVVGWDTWLAISDALARIGPPAVESLLGLLMSGAVVKRELAARALKQMNWHPTADAAGAVFWIEMNEPKKCAAIGVQAVEPLINGLSSSPLTETKKEIMQVLFQIGDPRAIPALIAHMKKPAYEEEGEAAAKYLVRFGAKAVEPLLDALEDNDSRQRAAAARVLGRIADARAIGPLTGLLTDQDGEVVTTAKKALSQIAAAEAARSSENAPPAPG